MRSTASSFPLVDLFYWGEQSADEKSLTSALFIGLDKVDGKWCNHYAYQQPGLKPGNCGSRAVRGPCHAGLSSPIPLSRRGRGMPSIINGR